MIPPETPLAIGCLLFEELDQLDLTGPFEVLSRIPNATTRLYARAAAPVRDAAGLRLVPDATLDAAPALDALVVPGGPGQEAVMEDEAMLGFVRRQAGAAGFVLSVCTGALICGAAGLLRGRRATTHWASFHLLRYFGAIPDERRVVRDGSLISTAGVTAGIDGALVLAAALRGEEAARRIELGMQYAPEPPFGSGNPETAPVSVRTAMQAAMQTRIRAREATAARVAARLGIAAP